jgi:hypothetical protein
MVAFLRKQPFERQPWGLPVHSEAKKTHLYATFEKICGGVLRLDNRQPMLQDSPEQVDAEHESILGTQRKRLNPSHIRQES